MSPTESILNDKSWSQALLESLERQHVVVNELARLAESQAPIISAAQTDRLLDVLARRQQLIDEFTASQREMGELAKGFDQRLEHVDSAQHERIKALIMEIGDQLAHILRRDEQDQTSLRGARQQVRQELSGLDAGRSARHAYAGGPAVSNRFADRRG